VESRFQRQEQAESGPSRNAKFGVPTATAVSNVYGRKAVCEFARGAEQVDKHLQRIVGLLLSVTVGPSSRRLDIHYFAGVEQDAETGRSTVRYSIRSLLPRHVQHYSFEREDGGANYVGQIFRTLQSRFAFHGQFERGR